MKWNVWWTEKQMESQTVVEWVIMTKIFIMKLSYLIWEELVLFGDIFYKFKLI